MIASILAVGDAVAPTGFARVMHEILAPLRERYRIVQLATNYDGDPHDWGWELYPAEAVNRSNRGVDRLPGLLAGVQPDLVFIVTDLWLAGRYAECIRETGSQVPIITYCPVEAGGIDIGALSRLREVSKLVLYTNFARNTIEEAIDAAGDRASYPKSFTSVMPHGINSVDFHPLGEVGDRTGKLEAKRKLLGADVDPDTFIVLNANRNQPRKRIDITMRAFTLFAKDKPGNVKLHLHMGLKDLGWDIGELARRFGIGERLILSTDGARMPELTNEELNLVYNAADVGLNTATGEGWGLPSFEHAATGSAQIVPRHGNLAEIWRDTALFVDPCTTLTDPGLLFDEHILDPVAVAAALEKVYVDAELRADLARRALELARNPAYQWARIAGKWDAFFQEHLGRKH